MSLVNTLVFLAAAAPGVLSSAITTITPCPANPTLAAPITVTEQYQTVSTCGVSVTCQKWGSCTTNYPFTTSVFVSTTIPCSWDGTSATPTVVTETDQVVTVSVASTTISSVEAVETAKFGNWGWQTTTGYTTYYETKVKEWDAPYETLGPIAVPGWGGSGLCEDCEEGDVKIQKLGVTDCHSGNLGGSSYAECVRYAETWIAFPNVQHSAPVTAHCQSQFSAPSAGTYVITFPQSAPPATVTIPARGGEGERVTVVPGQNWDAVVTRSCRAPTIIEIDIYITKVLIYIVPDWHQSTAPASSIPFTPIWEQWTASSSATSSLGPISTSYTWSTTTGASSGLGPISTSYTGSSSSAVSTSSSSTASSSGSSTSGSSSSTSFSTTASSNSTSTSTTSTTTGTPSATIIPAGETFALEVTLDGASSKKHKRRDVDLNTLIYLNFEDNNNAELGGYSSAATCVSDGDAHIKTEGLFIGAAGVDESDPALLQTSAGLPTFNFWLRYIDSDVLFILNRIFCLVNENEVSVLPEGTFCADVITLRTYPAPPHNGTSTSSTSVASSTTSSIKTTSAANATTTSHASTTSVSNSTTSSHSFSTTSSANGTSSTITSTTSALNTTTTSATLTSTTSAANVSTSTTSSSNGTTTASSTSTTTTAATTASVIAAGQTLQAFADVPLNKHKRAVTAELFLNFDDDQNAVLGAEGSAATLVSNDEGQLVTNGLIVGTSPVESTDEAVLFASVGAPGTSLWLIDDSKKLSLYERIFCLAEDLAVDTAGPNGCNADQTEFQFFAKFIKGNTTTTSASSTATTTSASNSTTTSVLSTTTGAANATTTSFLSSTTAASNATTSTTSAANATTTFTSTTSASNGTTTSTTSATATASVVAAGQTVQVSVDVPSSRKNKRDTLYLGINDQNIAQLGSQADAATLITGDGTILYGLEFLGSSPTDENATAFLVASSPAPTVDTWLQDSNGGIFLAQRLFCLLTSNLEVETVGPSGDGCDGVLITFHAVPVAGNTTSSTTASATATTTANSTSTATSSVLTTTTGSTTSHSILPGSSTTGSSVTATTTGSTTSHATTSASHSSTSSKASTTSAATTTSKSTTSKTSTTTSAGPTASGGGSVRRRSVPSNPLCAAFGSTCSLSGFGVQGTCCQGYLCSASGNGAQGDCAMCVAVDAVCESNEQCCSGKCLKEEFFGFLSLNKRGVCA